MTMPKGVHTAVQKLSEMVVEMFPRWRNQLTQEEEALAKHLRGNDALLVTLKGLIQTRISGRATIPVPSDPIQCRVMLERDHELRWLLSRLELVHRSPVSPPEDNREQPA